MSNDASSVLSVARREIGYSRWDDPQAGTKYGRWFAQKTGEPYYGESGVPYCAMFVSWVFDQAGATCAGLPGAYCPTMLSAASSRVVAIRSAQPGDIVYFDWGNDRVPDHVGIIEQNNGSYITTIEGNTSSGSSGSQGNGGVVARRTRSWNVVRAIVRPNYGGSSSTSSSSSGKIAEDGYWGHGTTLKAQEIAGTPRDGVVSSQSKGWRSHLPGCTAGWEWSSNPQGSLLIKAIQRVLGVNPDGIFGPDTTRAFINRYGNGIYDGELSYPSIAIKGFQRSLNTGHL